MARPKTNLETPDPGTRPCNADLSILPAKSPQEFSVSITSPFTYHSSNIVPTLLTHIYKNTL